VKQVQSMDEQVVWFHGTNSKEMVSEIEKEGFQAGTYFAQHMEDAVIFGGAYVFFVKAHFATGGYQWEVCNASPIPASAIIGHCYVAGADRLRKAQNKAFAA
jgi:hypothetical protein